MLPKPTLIKTEAPPQLTLPPVIVINRNEASFYMDACDDYEYAGQEDYPTLKEVQQMYPGISQDDACNFNIYGFTLQGWLNFESQMVKVAGYVEKLRQQIRYLEQTIEARQSIIERQEAILTEQEP